MKNVLLTRDEFRERCLERDKHQCVICSSKNNLSVHHILERRLKKSYMNKAYLYDV